MKNVYTKLEQRIISLEKNQAKSEQYNRCNNIELSGIPKDIPEDNLQKVLTDICYDSVSGVGRDSNKRVIINFVNRKYPEALLRNKKSISSKDFSHLNVHDKVFVSVSLCP